MSFKIIGAAFDLPLKGNDKLVFLALCENADDNTRTCYPSYSTIQRKASLANSSLKTSLMVLEAIGLISIKIRSTKNGGRTSTIYKIAEFEHREFDLENYKIIASQIRSTRNFREKKKSQSPKIDIVTKMSNLRKPAEKEHDIQSPKFDTLVEVQSPKFGEEPLASSFQPLASREEEEDVCICEIFPNIPDISPQMLQVALDRMVGKLAKSNPAKFRRRVLEKFNAGDFDTIQNIKEFARQIEAANEKRETPWKKAQREKRDRGMAIQQAMLAAGFHDPVAFLMGEDQK